MKILFTICGRAGSKGIKNKNIRDFNGKPLVYYTLSAIDLYLKESGAEGCHVALNTDSVELVNLVKKFERLEVAYIPRKEELATDRVAKRDVIVDTLRQMEERQNCQYDVVVDLDITSPIRTVQDVKNAIEKQRSTNADVVFSVVPCRRNPYFNMVMSAEHGYKKVMESTFNTRQEAPDIYDMNASIYVYKREHLMAGKGVLEGYNEISMMEDTGILDLDHEGDFELMEVIEKYFIETRKDFREVYMNI